MGCYFVALDLSTGLISENITYKDFVIPVESIVTTQIMPMITR